VDEARGDATGQRLPEMTEMARAQHDQVSPFGHDQHAEPGGRRRGRNDVTLGLHRQGTLRGSGRNLGGLAAAAESAREWSEAIDAGQDQPSSRRGRETSSERDGLLGMTGPVDTDENRLATATGHRAVTPSRQASISGIRVRIAVSPVTEAWPSPHGVASVATADRRSSTTT
jgi:hypothetical protein